MDIEEQYEQGGIADNHTGPQSLPALEKILAFYVHEFLNPFNIYLTSQFGWVSAFWGFDYISKSDFYFLVKIMIMVLIICYMCTLEHTRLSWHHHSPCDTWRVCPLPRVAQEDISWAGLGSSLPVKCFTGNSTQLYDFRSGNSTNCNIRIPMLALPYNILGTEWIILCY